MKRNESKSVFSIIAAFSYLFSEARTYSGGE